MTGWVDRAADLQKRQDHKAWKAENASRLAKGEEELSFEDWLAKEEERLKKDQQDEQFMKKYDRPEFWKQMDHLGAFIKEERKQREAAGLPA